MKHMITLLSLTLLSAASVNAGAAGFAELQSLDAKSVLSRTQPQPAPRITISPEPQSAQEAAAGQEEVSVPRKDVREDLFWKRINLKAADSTRITVDYVTKGLGGTIIAEPFWLTVSNPALTGREKVRAVVVTIYEATPSSKESVKETREVDLPYDGQYFQVKAPAVLIREGHHSWVHNFRQEIAVVIDGRWLTDPVNGTHNFRVKLDPVVNPYAKSLPTGGAEQTVSSF